MKKTLKSLAAIALIALSAAACQKEQLFDSQTAGEETVTFTVQTDLAATKAVADNDGLGGTIDKCLVAVYMKTGENSYKLYDTPETTGSGRNYNFTVNLLRKQTYQIVVWAHKDGAYTVDYTDTPDQISVSRNGVACNSDAYDAFYASVPFTQGTTASTTIEAKRPFAQLNLITKDLRTGFEPKDIELTYTADTKFNPFDGTTSDPQEITYTAAAHHYSTLTPAGENTVAMNYLLVGNEQVVLNDVKLKVTFTDDVDITVANVPVKRNYRTNIKGNLFTEQTDFNITVNPIWGASDIEVVVPSTYSEAQAAVADPNVQTVVVSQEVVDDYVAKVTSGDITPAVATLPDGSQKSLIEFKLTSTSPADLKQFELPAAPDGYAWHITHEAGYPTQNVDVVAPAASSVIIDAPNSHVTLNGQDYSTVRASTSGTTLVVPEGVTIAKLEVLTGGLEIHGTVTELVIAEDADVKVRDCEGLTQTVYDVAKNFLAPGYVGTKKSGKWNIALSDKWIERVAEEPAGFVKDDAAKTIKISTPEAFAWLSRNSQATGNYFAGYTVLLEDDIDLGAAYWSPVKMWSPESRQTFDGQGHTISNLKLKGSSTNDLSLFGSCTMTIKNFTLDGVTITGANGYTGAVVGHLYGDLEKITVKNANITASYWGIGGIVGFHNGGNMTDCHVIDSQINGGCPGGLTGVYNETDGRVYSNCSAENVILKDTSCWGRPYRYGSIVALVNEVNVEFVGCSSKNMTYIFGSSATYHTGDEGNYSTAPAHPLFGDVDNAKVIINGEKYIQGYMGAFLPAAPAVNGNVMTVNVFNAQYALDGAYGSIDGKTINFSAGTYPQLVFGRPNKYPGSNSIYRHGNFENAPMTYEDFVAYKSQSGWTEGCKYERIISNVTFTAESGAVLTGMSYNAGDHIYGSAESPVYDYVLDKGTTTVGSCYYHKLVASNITYEGITFQKVDSYRPLDISSSSAISVIDGVTVSGCNFIGTGTASTVGQAIRFYTENQSGAAGTEGKVVRNLVVKNTTINNFFQGIYTNGAYGVTVEGCTISTTGHNAIALQSVSSAVNLGEVKILSNNFENIGDRIIRLGNVAADSSFTITGNVATNSGDSNGEILKAGTLAEGITYDVHSNNWGEGKTAYNTEFRDTY